MNYFDKPYKKSFQNQWWFVVFFSGTSIEYIFIKRFFFNRIVPSSGHYHKE